MKRIFSFFAVAICVLVSCAKETQSPAELALRRPKVALSFGAAFGEGEKTVLDGLQTCWQNGDEISIFDCNNDNCRFSTVLSKPAASAEFNGVAAESETYYAIYPYDAAASISGNVITTTLPPAQTAVAGSFDPEAQLLAARTSTKDFQFFSAVALLEIKVDLGTTDADEAVTATVYANDGKGLAGTITETWASGEDILYISTGNVCHVTLNAETGKTLDRSKCYYVPVCPGYYCGGLSITLKKANSDIITKVHSGDVTLLAGYAYPITLSGSWTEETPAKIFTDSMQNGWTLGGTEGKKEICAEAAYSGTNGIKWTVDDAGSWARTLSLTAPSPGTDLSSYSAIRFKMKLVNSTRIAGETVFQNRVYGTDAESYHNVYAPADDSWRTITMPFSDFSVQTGSDIWTKLNNFCFHTTGWYSGTAVIYLDDIELIK